MSEYTEEPVPPWQEPNMPCEWWRYTGGAPCPNQAIVVLVHRRRRHDGGVIRRFAACEHHWYRDEHMYSWSEYILRDPRPMSLLCGAFASTWDARLRALLDAGDPSVLLDCVEERALHEPPVERDGVLVGPWPLDELGNPVRRQEWLEVTGRHEHTWLPAIGVGINDARGPVVVRPGGPLVRACPCGLYEHEVERFGPYVRVRIDNGRRTHFYVGARQPGEDPDELRGDIPDLCADPGCQREAGHPLSYCARYATKHGNIEEEEWDDEDTADHPRRTLIPAARHRLAESLARMTDVDAADITQRYLDGDPHVLD